MSLQPLAGEHRSAVLPAPTGLHIKPEEGHARSDQKGPKRPQAGDGADDDGWAVPGGDHPRCRAGRDRGTAILPGPYEGFPARSRLGAPAAEPSVFGPDRNGVANLDVVDGRVGDPVVAQKIDQFITVREGADARPPQGAVDQPRRQEMPRRGVDAVSGFPDRQAFSPVRLGSPERDDAANPPRAL